MPIKLDIESLRTLKSVADNGGVTRAARDLSLSQSAVSHKIKRLEDHLGCNLLTRRANAPLLTETGERMLGYANRILAIHDEAAATLDRRPLTGRIRLGMTEDMSSSGLAAILGRFARLFPDVAVRTHVDQSLVLRRQLDSGAIDLAVMQVFESDMLPGDVTLFRNRLCWARALDFRLQDDCPVPFLAYSEDCFYRQWLIEHAPSTGRAFRTVLECSSNAGILAAIEAGLGVSIVNEDHVSPAMTALDSGFPVPPEIVYVARTGSHAESNTVRALVGEIVRESDTENRLRVA